jgi:hypothetical protein
VAALHLPHEQGECGSRDGPRRVVGVDPGACSDATVLTRIGAVYSHHPAATGSNGPSGNALPLRVIGARSILAELEALHIRPLPSLRTIERVLQRYGISVPRVRLAPLVSRYTYPTPPANDSNHLHQVDCIGPIYLLGQRKRHYLWTCKDVYDSAVCLDLSRSRKMEAVLTFLGKCWKTLGRPRQVQFDNAREIVGWGPAARYLSRVLRLCLRFEIEPVLIPPAKPERHGYDSCCTSMAGFGLTLAGRGRAENLRPRCLAGAASAVGSS